MSVVSFRSSSLSNDLLEKRKDQVFVTHIRRESVNRAVERPDDSKTEEAGRLVNFQTLSDESDLHSISISKRGRRRASLASHR